MARHTITELGPGIWTDERNGWIFESVKITSALTEWGGYRFANAEKAFKNGWSLGEPRITAPTLAGVVIAAARHGR